jgi:hypothetical protein
MDWLPCSLIIALNSNKTVTSIRHNTVRLSERPISTDHNCTKKMTHTDTRTPVTRIRNREEVRAELPKGGAFVLLHHVHIVEMRQPLERVDCNQDVPGVRLSDHLPCQTVN